MKAVSQATLIELARASAVRRYALHGRADGYVLSVQYGLHEVMLTAKRDHTRRFARLYNALVLRVAAFEVRPAATDRLPHGPCQTISVLVPTHHLYYCLNMEMKSAVTLLAALAQDTRLSVFRLLVEQGPDGLPAGQIADRLDISPATLSFHLKELTHAGLTLSRQEGRFVIYSAHYEAMNDLLSFLTENCCAGSPCDTTASACTPTKRNR